ncbi:translation initiation factor eIF-1A [Candidatus Woesearchaeota archaeon]|nr:translation initiation factor eIF-1A [Candidatus Woesearchaeota archaeon]
MNKKAEELQKQQRIEQDIYRVKLPRGRQSIGILDQRLGASRMKVKCFDGKTRICRIPGRLKRKLWLREGDYILVEPWELGGDDKGDIVFKYRPAQIAWLKQKGHIKAIETVSEF